MRGLTRNAKKLTVALLAFSGLWLFMASASNAAEYENYDVEQFDAELSSNQAGAHPDFSLRIRLAQNPSSPEGADGQHEPYALTKDIGISVPPGLLGNLNAVDTCTAVDFANAKLESSSGCPLSAQIGLAEVHVVLGTFFEPIFKLEPIGDEVARIGFYVGPFATSTGLTIRSNGDFGVDALAEGITSAESVQEVVTTLWGVPAATIHDNERLTAKEGATGKKTSPTRSSGGELRPFMTNPTVCGQPLSVTVKADSYQEPEVWHEKTDSLGAIEDCGNLKFSPLLTLTPTEAAAASVSGADATLTIPQNEAINGFATSHLRNTVVRLPEGVAISPTAAEGLEACSAEQVGLGTLEPQHCPEAAKIATVELDSPSLERKVQGAVYQRTPEPGHLTRAWLTSDELGVHVKIPGEFLLDPETGQITSLFLETPQVPIREFKLHFKGGAHGVLATPRACGTYSTEYQLSPWSGGQDATGTTPMIFDENCGVGGFAPKLSAGSTNPMAGRFSTFVTDLIAASGEENLAGVSVTLPPGVLAKLAGVALCPDAVAGAGDCPAGSQVGTTAVAVGPGPAPLWVPQPGKEPTAIYLAGPYRGGPYSLVVKTPAQAGPFDLGDVVVRVALHVNPETALVTAVAESLPQILEGVPVTYRDVHVELNRPDFTLNPTSCDPMQLTGTATAASGQQAALVDGFQVGSCRNLAFKPKLQISLKGKTRRTGHPALRATLTMPSGGANISRTRVTLPPGQQIDNAHINNPCTRVQFNQNACPPSSVLGTARAFTPLLDQPLEGPVYFRSNGGDRALPDVVADLHGSIHIILVGFVDAKNARLRTTFANVPDAPVSKFSLNLYGGKRGLLVNNRNLCKSKNEATVLMDAQNGKLADSTITVPNSCKKHKSGKK
jgi:hypothetical protein